MGFDCPDCKYIAVLLARYGIGDKGLTAIGPYPQLQADKYYVKRLRRVSTTLYYCFEFKGKKVFKESVDYTIYIPDSCKEAWFFYADCALDEAAQQQMQGNLDKYMHKINLVSDPCLKEIPENGFTVDSIVEEFKTSPTGLSPLSTTGAAVKIFDADTRHLSGASATDIEKRWSVLLNTPAYFVFLFSKMSYMLKTMASLMAPSKITRKVVAFIHDPVGIAIEWQSLGIADQADLSCYYEWYDFPLATSGLIHTLIENQPDAVTEDAEKSRNSRIGRVSRAFGENLEYREVINYNEMVAFEKKRQGESDLMAKIVRERHIDRIKLLTQPNKCGTIAWAFETHLLHSNKRVVLPLYAKVHDGIASALFNFFKTTQDVNTSAPLVKEEWFSSGKLETDHGKLFLKMISLSTQDGDLPDTFSSFAAAIILCGNQKDDSVFKQIMKAIDTVVSLEISKQNESIYTVGKRLRLFLKAEGYGDPFALPLNEGKAGLGQADRAVDTWSTVLDRRSPNSTSKFTRNIRFTLRILQSVNALIAQADVFMADRGLDKVRHQIAALCAFISLYAGGRFRWTWQKAGKVAGGLGVAVCLLDAAIGLRDRDYGVAIGGAISAVSVVGILLVSNIYGLAGLVLLSFFGTYMGIRFKDSVTEEFLKLTPWYPSQSPEDRGVVDWLKRATGEEPIWQEPDYARWPALSYKKGWKEILKLHPEFKSDMLLVTQKMYALCSQPFVNSLWDKRGGKLYIRVIMPEYLPGRSNIDVLLFWGMEKYGVKLSPANSDYRILIDKVTYGNIEFYSFELRIVVNMSQVGGPLIKAQQDASIWLDDAPYAFHLKFDYSVSLKYLDGESIKLAPVNPPNPPLKYWGISVYPIEYGQGKPGMLAEAFGGQMYHPAFGYEDF